MNQLKLITYEVHTLVDITKTNITSANDVNLVKQRNQQRNWETLTQVLNLRTQIFNLTDPVIKVCHMSQMNFGQEYVGEYKVWSCKFDIEHIDVFGDEKNPVKFLSHDFDKIPIIAQLDETQIKGPCMFIVDGPYKNVYFSIDNNG